MEIMSTKATHRCLIILLLATVAAGIAVYPHLPNEIASHWNVAGEADNYMGKFWGVFLFPALLAGFYLLYAIIPRIDPLKDNIRSFRSAYNLFFIGLAGFFTYLFALSLWWNLGRRFDFGAAMMPALAALLWMMGMLLQHAKRNWFVGIRTPWTLSSDRVWKKTHELGSKLFKIAAVIALAGALFGGAAGFLMLMGPLLAAAVITIVYSYLEYQKEKR